MTEDTTPSSEVVDDFTEAELVRKDPALNLLLAVLTPAGGDASFSLTIASDGAIVSGLAITPDEWVRLMTDALKGANSGSGQPDAGQIIGEAFEKTLRKWLEENDALEEKREAQNLPSVPRKFVYLKDARVTAGGATFNVPFWRGAVSDISGWTLGTY